MKSLRAIQHLRPLNRRHDSEHLIRASDNHCYSVNLADPCGSRSSVVNMLGGRLCEFAGIDTASPALLEVAIDIPRFATADHSCCPVMSGVYLGNKYPVDPETSAIYDFLPDGLLERVDNSDDFWMQVPIDLWLGNSWASKTLFYRRALGTRMYRQACLFRSESGPGDSWPGQVKAGLPIHSIRHYCGGDGRANFEKVFDRLLALKESDLKRLFDDLPERAVKTYTPLINQVAQRLVAEREALFMGLTTMLNSMQHRVDAAEMARIGQRKEIRSSGLRRSTEEEFGETAQARRTAPM